jgi:hypothetical protein
MPTISKSEEPDDFLDSLLSQLAQEQQGDSVASTSDELIEIDEHSYAVSSVGAQSPVSSDSGLSSDFPSRPSPSSG